MLSLLYVSYKNKTSRGSQNLPGDGESGIKAGKSLVKTNVDVYIGFTYPTRNQWNVRKSKSDQINQSINRQSKQSINQAEEVPRTVPLGRRAPGRKGFSGAMSFRFKILSVLLSASDGDVLFTFPCHGRFVRWGETRTHSPVSGLYRVWGCSAKKIHNSISHPKTFSPDLPDHL
jgi:hypothetical protein